MTAEELLAAFRHRADDAHGKELYSDETLYRFASEAEREACLRAKLIYDTTGDCTTLAIVAGTHTYALDPIVDRIDSVSFTLTSGGRAYDLPLRGIDWMRDQYDWASRTGRPLAAIHIDRTLRLWPTPGTTQAGTARLGVYRFPLDAMADGADEPEIPEEHHPALVDWMLYLAYSTKDSEAEDTTRAATHAALFTAHFGPRPSADALRRHREHRRITTRYGGL